MNQTVQAILRDFNPGKNPYFRALEDRSFERGDFVETQVQFYNAVVHIHRPMRTLANRTPSDRNREKILANIQDELGHGNAQDSHEQTFLCFLNRIANLSETEVRKKPVWAELRAFNQQIDHACAHQDYRFSAALLGMIEHLFSDVSTRIGKHLIQEQWMSPENLIHYNTHAVLDVQHAQDFYDVALPDWAQEADLIPRGLQQGAQLLDNLYRDLYRHRQQRNPACL